MYRKIQKKGLDMGSRGPPGLGGFKNQKRVQNELNCLKKFCFESAFRSSETFSAPEDGRPREPISRLLSNVFTVNGEIVF